MYNSLTHERGVNEAEEDCGVGMIFERARCAVESRDWRAHCGQAQKVLEEFR